MMVDGWKKNKLKNLVSSITTGKLDANAMIPNGQYRFYTCAKDYCYIDKYAFDDEALLISGNGEYVGYIHYYKGKFNAYQRVYVITGFGIDVRFLQSYLNRYLPIRINKEVSQNNIPYIRLSTLSQMCINYPESRIEQTAIANILSKVDEAIASVQKSISAAERLKKSLMQNLLTGRMKPDGTFRKEDEFYVDEKFGRVPKGWEVKRIDEIAERKTDVIDPTKTKEVYDYIGLEHIVPDEFIRCGKGLSNETIALKVKFEKGDLLYAKLRPYLNKVVISDISGVGSTEFIILKQDDFTHWVYLNFQLQRFLNYTKSMTAGTQHPRASWKDIKHYLVCVPKEKLERESIENQLLSLERLKKQKQYQIAVLERLKKSLMQNLLTGKVRVGL